MGLTKQYLAYRPVDTCNIIASSRVNVNFLVYNNIDGRYVVCGAAENAIIWDLRLGERVLSLRRGKQEVTALRASPDRLHVAVGYVDGVVEIFNLSTQTSECTLSLHKSAVAILRYDTLGIRLVSGGLDTDLVVIDVIEQAGRQRLVGHNAPITDAHFLERCDADYVLVTSSKDTQIKFWNLDTQYCFKTIVDNRTVVWALALIGDLLVAGSNDSTMNVYRLRKREMGEERTTMETAVEGLCIDDEDAISPITVTNCGTIVRASKGHVVSLVVDQAERVLACSGTSKLIEIFYSCNEAETKRRLAKRLRKARKKVVDASIGDGDGDGDGENTEIPSDISLVDEIKRLPSITVKTRLKSIDIVVGGNSRELRIVAALADNSVQLFSVNDIGENKRGVNVNVTEAGDAKMVRSLDRLGHHSEVRTICFSSDSSVIASGAGDTLKLWNRDTLQCLRTVSVDYALCTCFVPGDQYVLVGTKSGRLLIVEVATAEIIEEIPAHDNELWSLSVLPDQKGCITGSTDKTVKIWIFELVDAAMDTTITMETNATVQVLSLLHKNTLQLDESVLCVCISSDMKFLAVGLLDANVKIFFLDSFKFYLTLYGHKLPILCIDISTDGMLCATGSADRNIKVWGLDFGDCHRSLFAHDDSVMALQFIPKTHMFFSCGKDGAVKQWDADTFEKIQSLPGHIGEAYNLALSKTGRYLASCGSDRTLRLFELTDEILVLQDVQEEEREEQENQELATGDNNAAPLLPGLKMPSRKTVGAEKAVESILECLDICKQYDDDNDDVDGRVGALDVHPIMRALNVNNTDDYLLEVLARIRAADLETALLLLTFSHVCQLLQRLPRLIERCSHEIELITKVTMFVMKIHFKAITTSTQLKPLLQQIGRALRQDVSGMRDTLGMNLYAMKMLQRDIEERDEVEIFRDLVSARKKREKKHRNATKRRLQIEMH